MKKFVVIPEEKYSALNKPESASAFFKDKVWKQAIAQSGYERFELG